MSLIRTFINNPEKIGDRLNRIRQTDTPKMINKSWLLSIGFSERDSILYIGLLQNLDLIHEDGQVKPEFERFSTSESEARRVIAERVWDDYARIFEEDMNAHKLPMDDLCSIFKKVHGNETSDIFIELLAKTFKGLVEYLDWDKQVESLTSNEEPAPDSPSPESSLPLEMDNEDSSDSPSSSDDLMDFLQEMIDGVTEHTYTYSGPTDINDGQPAHIEDIQIQEPGEEVESVSSQVPDRADFHDSSKRIPVGMTVPNRQAELTRDENRNDRKESILKALHKRAELLTKLKRNSEAAEALDQIARWYEHSNDPNRNERMAEVILQRADILEGVENYEEALLAYESFINRFYDQGTQPL